MNATNFLFDLRNAYAASGMKQPQVASAYGIDQGNLSRMLRGKYNVGLSAMQKLWPFVYGAEFPEIPARKQAEPARQAD